MHDLRTARPDVRIVLFVTANNAEFARLLTDPDDIVELPVRKIPTAIRMVRDEECDVILDLTSWRRYDAVLVDALGRARRRSDGGRRTSSGTTATTSSSTTSRDHEIDNDRRLLAALGVTSTSAPHLELPKGATSPLPTPYVVFHLWPGGANFEERSWPTESWRTLAQAMNARGFAVVLTGGPGDAQVNRELADRWVADGIRAQNAAGTDWPDSLGWLGFASGVDQREHRRDARGRRARAHRRSRSTVRRAACGGARSVRTRGASRHRWCPTATSTSASSTTSATRDCMRAITVDMVLAAWDDLRAEAVAAGRA